MNGGESFAMDGGESFAMNGGESFAMNGGKSLSMNGGESFAMNGGESFAMNGGESFAMNGGKSLSSTVHEIPSFEITPRWTHAMPREPHGHFSRVPVTTMRIPAPRPRTSSRYISSA
jgi:hypothetical protein